MNVFPLSEILKTRMLVGYLGERAHFSWWPTAFFESSSRMFLEPVFARTYGQAQYYGVLEAARRLHDEHLSVGSYHLFRLPEEIEQDLHNNFQNSELKNFAERELISKQVALASLASIADSATASCAGPAAIGKIGELDSRDTTKSIAAAYLSAFSQDIRTYPYLVA